MWHELKEYLRREVKPSRKEELVAGIKQFLETVDVAKCQKYIRHLRKVLPKIIGCNGKPTGYQPFIYIHVHVYCIIDFHVTVSE